MLASILWSKAASSGSDGQRLGSGRLRAPCGAGTLWGAEQHENRTQWHFIPPRRVQPALGLHPQDITGPELARGPASHGSNPAGFQAPVEGLSRAEKLLYLPSEMQSGAGDGRKADGGGTGPTPPRGTACAFLGRVPPEAESRRCAHTASDIIIILIMKGQLLQSSSPLRRRERRMQRRCVSLIPSSCRESGRDARPAGPLLGCCPGVTKLHARSPPSPVTLPAGSLATGESLRESGATRSCPPGPVPITALCRVPRPPVWWG